MQIKTLKFTDADGKVHFLRPVRPLNFNDLTNNKVRDYSEEDTPNGSQSVVFQAIKTLRRKGVKLGFKIPEYSLLYKQESSVDQLRAGNICPEIPEEILSKFEFIDVELLPVETNE